MNFDNIEIDPTALVVMGGFALGMIIAPFDATLIKREYKLEWLYHTAKFILMFLLGGALYTTLYLKMDTSFQDL